MIHKKIAMILDRENATKVMCGIDCRIISSRYYSKLQQKRPMQFVVGIALVSAIHRAQNDCNLLFVAQRAQIGATILRYPVGTFGEHEGERGIYNGIANRNQLDSTVVETRRAHWIIINNPTVSGSHKRRLFSF